MEESAQLPAGLGYVRVNGLFADAGVAIADILATWSVDGVDGVVLDLRGANGGDLDSAVTVASLMSKPDRVLFRFRNAAGTDLEVHRARAGASVGVPLMLHYAEKDERINEGIPKFRAALEEHDVVYHLYEYPDTGHGFHNDTSRARYRPSAAKLAWLRTMRFFKDNLVS